jgi:prepilin-type N-terminal cleavage/methylation domain-containing protein
MKAKAKKPSHTRAMTLIEVLVVIAVLVILAMLLLPAVAHVHRPRIGLNCTSNLKLIGLAFRLWSGDNNDKFPMQVSITNGGTHELVFGGNVFPHFQVMSNELNTPRVIVCPEDKPRVRELGKVKVILPSAAGGSDFTFLNECPVSYFVGVDTDLTHRTMLLAGDWNITVGGSSLQNGLFSLTTNSPVGWSTKVHNTCGNILLADGSVRMTDAKALRKLLVDSGAATNRLAIP